MMNTAIAKSGTGRQTVQNELSLLGTVRIGIAVMWRDRSTRSRAGKFVPTGDKQCR